MPEEHDEIMQAVGHTPEPDAPAENQSNLQRIVQMATTIRAYCNSPHWTADSRWKIEGLAAEIERTSMWPEESPNQITLTPEEALFVARAVRSYAALHSKTLMDPMFEKAAEIRKKIDACAACVQKTK